MKSRRILFALATLVLMLGAGAASAHIAENMDQAKAMAAETGLPIILEVGTSW